MRAWLVVALVAGCNPYDRDLGSTPFLCGPTEPRCPKDYNCMTDPATGADVCFAANANTFSCADDSAREPNESFQMPMPLDASHITGLAICPAGDVDTFSFAVAQGQSIELVVTFEAEGAALMGAILDPAGAPIANAAPDASMAGTLRGQAPTVAAGTYFVAISGPRTGINNYELTVGLAP